MIDLRYSLIIEATEGLGDKLVSGEVTPARFSYSKIYKSISTLANDDTDKCISSELLEKLSDNCILIENLFVSAQDIEWAVKDNEIFLLQARPITNLPEQKPKTWDDWQIWTNINTGEVIPDVVTPLTQSIIKPSFDRMLEVSLSALGIEIKPLDVLALIGGKYYFNVNAWYAIVIRSPFITEDMATVLFGGRNEQYPINPAEFIPPEGLPKVKVKWLKLLLNIPSNLIKL